MSSSHNIYNQTHMGQHNQFTGGTFYGNQNFYADGSETPEMKCLRCLYTSDYDSQRRRNPKRVEGTLTWFLNHDKYQHWHKREASLLWVSADPGCGKSVLASFLVDELKVRLPPSDTICFFFFKDDDEKQKKATFALSALLHQLFAANNVLIKHAVSDFESKGEKFTEEFGTLWRIFKAATTDPDCGNVVCIIDALDECEEQTRKELVRSLVSMYDEATSTARHTNKTYPKFILTSRGYGSIEREFKRFPTIRLKAEEQTPAISGDIELVVNSEVEELGRAWDLTDGDRERLRDNLINGADRTFLWVSLILKILHGIPFVNEHEFRTILSDIPSDLDALYEKILRNSPKPAMAKKLLQIVVAAARPLTLTEIDIALGVRSDTKSLEDLRPYRLPALETSVKDICGLFVKVIDSKVYLIHQTAKEFLMKPSTTNPTIENSMWKQSLCPIESNLTLAQSCIYYLSFTAFETDPLNLETPPSSWESQVSIRHYTGKHVFLDYAAKHWAVHTQEAKIWEGEESAESGLKLFNSGSRRLLTWFLVYETTVGLCNFPLRNVTGLAVASYIGYDPMVDMLIEQGNDVNNRNDLFGSALNAAARREHRSVVKLLLNRGAIVYLFEAEYRNLSQAKLRDFRAWFFFRRRRRREAFAFAEFFAAAREEEEAFEFAARRIAHFLENFCLDGEGCDD